MSLPLSRISTGQSPLHHQVLTAPSLRSNRFAGTQPEAGQASGPVTKHEGMIGLYNSPEFYDLLFNSRQEGLELYIDEARKVGGRVLELTAGSGRLTIPMAKAGLQMTGLDLSEPMLALGRKKAADEKVNVNFVHGDATRFDLKQQFDMVMIAASGLFVLNSREAMEACLQQAYAHLRPGGTLMLDVMSTTSPFLTDLRYKLELKHTIQPPSGEPIIATIGHSHYDPTSHLFQYRIVQEGANSKAPLKQDTVTLQLVPEAELKQMLKRNGFEVRTEYGDYTRSPKQPDSMAHILLCTKKEGA